MFKSSYDGVWTAHVFEGNEATAWTQNAPHLCDGLSFVRNAAKRYRAHHGIEALIGKRECLRVPDNQLDLPTQAMCAKPCDLQHGRADLDPRDLHIVWIEGQVAPGANGNLQNLPSRLGTGPGSAITKQELFVECHCSVIFCS